MYFLINIFLYKLINNLTKNFAYYFYKDVFFIYLIFFKIKLKKYCLIFSFNTYFADTGLYILLIQKTNKKFFEKPKKNF